MPQYAPIRLKPSLWLQSNAIYRKHLREYAVLSKVPNVWLFVGDSDSQYIPIP